MKNESRYAPMSHMNKKVFSSHRNSSQFDVWPTQFCRQSVPEPCTRDRKASITESRVCSRYGASVDVRRPQSVTTNVGDNKLTVVNVIWRREIIKCFVDQQSQLEINTLTHGKPVEFSRQWCNVPIIFPYLNNRLHFDCSLNTS